MQRVVIALMLALLLPAICRAQETTLEITAPQTAGMSMFRAHWDTPLVLRADGPQRIIDTVIKDRGGMAEWKNGQGALAFDALNRSLLVRFPDAAEQIATEIQHGKTIRKVELVLPFRDEELWPIGNVDYVGPDGYTCRMNWGVDAMYRASRPQWHAVAWALRRPWSADAKIGPTFNAAVNGTVYWSKYGAGDEQQDRFPTRFGPAEVSYKQPEGRLDLTPVLTDASYGATLAKRLRTLADCGVLVQKEETYDIRYYTGSYEWGTGTGGRAILVNAPKLVVTLAPGKAELGAMAPPVDVAAIAAGAKVGTPTAMMPDPAALAALATQSATKPAGMTDWQWQHVRDLQGLSNPKNTDQPFWYQFVPEYLTDRYAKFHWENHQKVYDKPADPAAVYQLWVDQWIGRQPRGWSGFETARAMAEWHLYHQALPGPAQDAVRRYWTAWLMPDRDTATDQAQRRNRNDVSGLLVHPMCDDPRVGGADANWPDPAHGRFDTYYAKTGDWRGNKSFFRSGFCYDMSTQNFNTTSSSGALLAGALINSNRAMADGRHGVEDWLLRTWCWSGGMGQEHIDHYYFSITLAGNKAIADFSQTPYDRLVGQSLLTKDVEELVSAYHPGLRGFIAGSSRSSLEYLRGMQDGLQHIMHTLSRSGAEHDLGVDTFPGGYKRIGHDVAPELAAQLTMTQPWAPDWVLPMVDDKPLPYAVTGTGWAGLRRAYLGKNYGLATAETASGRFQAMAQWRREPKQIARTAELGTLDMRYTVNTARWTNDGQGALGQPGSMACLQQKNKLIAITSPRNCPEKDSWKNDVTSLQSSIGFFSLQDGGPTWEIYVDGQRAGPLPFSCKQGQKITIKDGVTYLGIIPLPATDLGRDAEVTLQEGVPQKMDLNFYNSTMKAQLVINSYNYKGDKPITDPAQKLAVGKAYGGFTVEIGDVDEWGDFAKFQQHIAAAKAEVAFDAKTNVVAVSYTSGQDVLRASSCTFVEKKDGSEAYDPNLRTHTLNGVNTDLPPGIELDTPYAQQGFNKIAKNGATLAGDDQRRLFLLTEPKAGVYCGWNPVPDLTHWQFTVPDGPTVTADGRLGLCRMVARPQEKTLVIDHYFKGAQQKDTSAATALLITGVDTPPAVTLNGKALGKLETRTVDGKKAWVVPVR